MNRKRRRQRRLLAAAGVLLTIGGIALPMFGLDDVWVPLALLPAMVTGADPTQLSITQVAVALLWLLLLALALICAFLLARVGWATPLPQEPAVGQALVAIFAVVVAASWAVVLAGHGLDGSPSLPPGLVALSLAAGVGLVATRSTPTVRPAPTSGEGEQP